MPEAAIVGAGVIGASIAWHLRKLGMRDVILLERGDGPGEGSTGRATGGFRAQYGTEINVRLSLLAREELRNFRELTGVDPGLDPRGYLFLAANSAELSILREALEIQHRCGLHESRLVSASDIAAINPFIRGEFAGGTFCPSDGFIRPLEILRGYLREANVRYRSQVISITPGYRIGLADGSFVEADHVVDAGGAWASSVASMLGVELPVVPLRRQVAATVVTDRLPVLPMTIWTDGFHFRVRDGRVLLLWPNAGAPDPYSTEIEPSWLEKIRVFTRERVPALADVPIEQSWGGLYEMSPDKHAILGEALPNFWLCNGSSGHGVMHSPALGLLLAQMITRNELSIDARILRPSRFREGQPIVAPELL